MKKNVLYVIGLILTLAVACLLYGMYAHLHGMSPVTTGVYAGSTKGMTFEIATTSEQQALGLGGREVIPDKYGMLFVFPENERPGFWMKDMLAPIDIIWLTETGTITKIDASVATSTYPSIFYPPLPVRYVLETRAGFAQAKGWAAGTAIDLPAPYASQSGKNVLK